MESINIDYELQHPELRDLNKIESKEIDDFLEKQIDIFVATNDEKNANYWAILFKIFEVQNMYIKIYELFELKDFYVAWCQLARIEITIKNILRHISFTEDKYKLLFIQQYTTKLQSLFPYKLFGSSEYVKKEIKCSICNSIISLRKRCAHKKGELYMGQMCHYVITQSELIGIAVVTEPFNKYSVIGVTKKEDDRYQYTLIEYLMSLIDHPFNEWSTKKYRIFEPHSKFRSGRNDECPCGSKAKYKKCCIKKKGIDMEHTEFILRQPTIKSLRNDERDTKLACPINGVRSSRIIRNNLENSHAVYKNL